MDIHKNAGEASFAPVVALGHTDEQIQKSAPNIKWLGHRQPKSGLPNASLTGGRHY